MNTKVLILLFIAIAVGLVSCKKENGDLPPITITSSLYLINAGPDTLNIFQNGTRIDNTTSFFTGGALGYYNVAYGTQNYQLKKAGKPDYLVSLPLQLDSAKTYSLFIAGELTDKIFFLNDVWPADGKNALIRVVDASPMTANVDVSIGTNSYPNNAFKSATKFIAVAPGPYTLNVYQSGTTSALVPAKTLTLSAGTTYTLFTYGVINGTGNNAFGAKLITNGQN